MKTTTIYVRSTWMVWYRRLWRWVMRRPKLVGGSDITGDGSIENPYGTFKHSIQSVPLMLKPGERFVIDLANVKEKIP
jgi:hypothetical protein